MSASKLTQAPAQLLTGARVLTPEGIREDAWVQLVDGRIASIGRKRPEIDAEPTDLEGAWLLPGFIDLHMHGGGGHSVAGSLTDMAQAVAYHAAHGTTATLVSLMTAPVDDLVEQLHWAAELTRRGSSPGGCVLGAHLEGPFLSHQRCGAQNQAHMIAPDQRVLARLLGASEGALRMMTLAPELDGALELVAALREAGVIAALGHSDATYEQGMAAISAGATHATHLFNAMRPLHHRAPGLIGAALHARLACELINDGRHVHPAVIRLVFDSVPCPLLVTDAIDATGVGDGRFVLGGQTVNVHDGEARLASTGSLAGSTLTMDRALRGAVKASGLSIERASAAASANPARVLGLEHELGSIATGHRADLVVLDDQLEILNVSVRGSWLGAPDALGVD